MRLSRVLSGGGVLAVLVGWLASAGAVSGQEVQRALQPKPAQKIEPAQQGQPADAGRPGPQTRPAEGAGPKLDESFWLRNVKQLTTTEMGLDRAGEAYFSHDGKRISFQAYPTGKDAYQIYVMNLDGTGLKLVSTGEGATTCSYFHPDGTKMIFASNHLDQRPAEMPEEVKKALGQSGQGRYNWPFFPGMDIFEYTFATGQLKRLTTTEGYDAEGSYSPDGKQIVFCSMRDGDAEIYIMDADGGNSRRITRAKGYDGGPFFSPDGKRVVYRADRHANNDGTMQIFVNNTEGTAEQAITDHDVLNWCPFWHPSGKWIIFTKGLHPKDGPPLYDLWIMRDDGSQKMQVTSDPAFDGLPVFSADGRYVMWTSKRNGIKNPQIFMAEFIGITPEGELRVKVR
jgi:TolB protein